MLRHIVTNFRISTFIWLRLLHLLSSYFSNTSTKSQTVHMTSFCM